jgi:DNA-binding NtrC family response regulator
MAGNTIELEHLPQEFINFNSAKIEPMLLPERGIELDALEANFIHQALNRTKGNRSKTAKLLGLTRDTLIYRMQKHGFH